jgi:GrpB-like predicted nucleotidyltransferase (UPF0157 family)
MSKLKKAISDRYVFKPYKSHYPKLFKSQKKFISKILKKVPDKEIHHIGSTSVPGLGGKGILDIIVVVPKKYFSKSKTLLHEAGYKYDHTMNKRHFHRKYYVDYTGEPRLTHLHLTFQNSGELIIALAFAEYLRAHKKVREQYAKIKKKASKLHSSDSKNYVKFKLNFVESTLKKALKWYKKKD